MMRSYLATAWMMWFMTATCDAATFFSGSFQVAEKENDNISRKINFQKVKIGIADNKKPLDAEGNFSMEFEQLLPGEKIILEILLPEGWQVLDQAMLTVTLPLNTKPENKARHKILLCKSEDCKDLALIHFNLKSHVDKLLNTCEKKLAAALGYKEAASDFIIKFNRGNYGENTDIPVRAKK